MLLLCSNEQFVININSIRLLSSVLLLISYYLPAPVVSLFIVSSPKLVSPCDSSTAERGKRAFSPLSQKSLSDTSANFKKLLRHHFTCTPQYRQISCYYFYNLSTHYKNLDLGKVLSSSILSAFSLRLENRINYFPEFQKKHIQYSAFRICFYTRKPRQPLLWATQCRGHYTYRL